MKIIQVLSELGDQEVPPHTGSSYRIMEDIIEIIWLSFPPLPF